MCDTEVFRRGGNDVMYPALDYIGSSGGSMVSIVGRESKMKE